MRVISTLCLLATLVAGCAQPAKVDNMVAKVPTGEVVHANLKRAIIVTDVSGGEPTSPLWVSKVDNDGFRGALNRSLDTNQMKSPDAAAARYGLKANLVSLSQPLAGLSMTVKAAVKYTLTDLKTKKVVYDEFVSVTYTAKFTSTLLGVQRLRYANEGAIRTNIEKMIADLIARARTFR